MILFAVLAGFVVGLVVGMLIIEIVFTYRENRTKQSTNTNQELLSYVEKDLAQTFEIVRRTGLLGTVTSEQAARNWVRRIREAQE